MKILVFIKETPETVAVVQPTSDGSDLDRSSWKYIVNPYDDFAIEEALKLKQEAGSGEIVVATIAPESAKERLLKPLAMGADRALLVNNQGFESADSLQTSLVLAKIAESEKPDIIFCGQQGIDGNDMHVPTMVAEHLNLPHVNAVCEVKVADSKAEVKREIEGGQVEVYDVQLPAVFGASKSLNSPRYASVPGIMKARKKPMDKKTIADLGIDVANLGASNKAVIKGYEAPPEKPEGQLFQGEETNTMVSKVVDLLFDEAKVL